MQILNDLIKLYEDTDKTYHESDRKWKRFLDNKEFEKVPHSITKKEDYLDFKESLKDILKKHFKIEIELEIAKTEKEYKKQHNYAVSAWESYGSELAGDFNSGEVNAEKKLKLLKGILECTR